MVLVLPAFLAACGGEQPQAPAEAPAAQVTAPATAAVLQPPPTVQQEAPAHPPYAYLWEEALRQRPWPRFRPNGQPNGQPSGSAPLPDPDPDDGAASNPLPASVSIPLPSAPPPEDPDPYRVLPPTLDMRVLAPYLQGVASWYGPTFHGKPTANGEIYNQYGLTAAHPVLPIGTKIQVENLENQRKVWVRVNDRGPYAKGRVLDLSKIAAQRLGMIENGTAQVRITVLSWPDTVNPNLGLKAYTQYVVQAAAYPDLDEAESLRERLQARFPQSPVMIDIASNGFFAVVAGPFDEEAAARQLSRQLQRDGITNLVRRYRN